MYNIYLIYIPSAYNADLIFMAWYIRNSLGIYKIKNIFGIFFELNN